MQQIMHLCMCSCKTWTRHDTATLTGFSYCEWVAFEVAQTQSMFALESKSICRSQHFILAVFKLTFFINNYYCVISNVKSFWKHSYQNLGLECSQMTYSFSTLWEWWPSIQPESDRYCFYTDVPGVSYKIQPLYRGYSCRF